MTLDINDKKETTIEKIATYIRISKTQKYGDKTQEGIRTKGNISNQKKHKSE